MSRKLFVHWQRFGPYHLARLQSAKQLLAPQGWTVIGLEIASTDNVYKWNANDRSRTSDIITVFPAENYDTINQLKLLRRLWGVLEAERPDAVAICGYSSIDSFTLLLWSRFRAVPAILMFETCVYDKQRNFIVGLIKRHLVRRFDAAMCGGQRHAWYLRSMGFPGTQIAVGYDVVDNAHFKRGPAPSAGPVAMEQDPGTGCHPGCFLASSRFVARKNIEGLIHAYREYTRTTPNPWRLVILGDGPLKSEIMAAAEAIPGNLVQIAGFKQYDDLPRYYASASVFIHPAHREAWGLVVNEAIASGLPILVGERVGCAADLVVNGLNGFRFPTGRTSALTELMTRFAELSNEERAEMGRWSTRLSQGVELSRFGQGLDASLRRSVKSQAFRRPRDPKRVDAFGRVRLWMPERALSVLRAVKYQIMWAKALRMAQMGSRRYQEAGASDLRNHFAFIVGAGRSGTTILGTVLELHRQITYLFEPYHLWAAVRRDMDVTNIFNRVDSLYSMTAADVGPDDRSRFRALFDSQRNDQGAGLVVEKMPHNAVRMDYIARLAPNAKFIHIVRDGCDVAGSIERISISGSYRMLGLRHYHQWWGVDHSKWHAILRDAQKYGLPLDEVGSLTSDLQRGAVEWLISCLAVEAYRHDHPDSLLEIKYDRLVQSTPSVLRELADYLNIPVSDAWLEKATNEVRDFTRPRTSVLRLPPGLRTMFNDMQEHFGFVQRAEEISGGPSVPGGNYK